MRNEDAASCHVSTRIKIRVFLSVFALCFVALKCASAQVSAYVGFSANDVTGGLTTQTTNILYGPTIGLTAQISQKGFFKIYGDVRGGLYGGKNRLDEIGVGPRLSVGGRKLEASAAVIVGFGRYNDGLGNPASGSTDAQIQIIAAVDRRISERFDWRIIDYSYQQYYGSGGEFNPKTFSTGIVIHLGKR